MTIDRNRNHRTDRVHAAGYPVLGANGALLRPGHAGLHELADYADDVETVASELVTNAIEHGGAALDIGLELTHPGSSDGGSSRRHRLLTAPRQARPAADIEGGRGLQIVEALSARWGWRLRTPARPSSRSSPGRDDRMEAISDLPMLHDIDADYSPQYIKLARIIRDKIESGEYRRRLSLANW